MQRLPVVLLGVGIIVVALVITVLSITVRWGWEPDLARFSTEEYVLSVSEAIKQFEEEATVCYLDYHCVALGALRLRDTMGGGPPIVSVMRLPHTRLASAIIGLSVLDRAIGLSEEQSGLETAEKRQLRRAELETAIGYWQSEAAKQ